MCYECVVAMRRLVFTWLLASCVLWRECSPWRLFHLGRMRGKNLERARGVGNKSVPDLWYEQRLDHFDSADSRTWQQRYFVNDSFWEKDGPIFLMIGGEAPANSIWLEKGTWIDYAREHKALCFLLEHRYYGKSRPTLDLRVKNLRWLSSKQALFDLAEFITSMNEVYSIPVGTHWIAFGGSYPGSLAAWLRAKYSHLVHAAVSSSGPLLAKADFSQYYEVVASALRTHSTDCVSTLKAATSEIEEMILSSKGRALLQQLFRLCEPVSATKKLNIASLFETLAENVAGIVQYSGDNRQFDGAKGVNITVPFACNLLEDSSLGAPVHRVAALNSLLLDTYSCSCLDYSYDSTVKQLRNVSWSSLVAEGGRQWMWQTCNEFGFYQTSSGIPNLFGDFFPLNFFIKQCEDVFGTRFNREFVERAVDQTNVEYGAFTLDASRVVFVHGSLDPWHALGITHTLHQESPALYIDGTAHCADMYPPSSSDITQLHSARKQIDLLLTQWLSEYSYGREHFSRSKKLRENTISELFH